VRDFGALSEGKQLDDSSQDAARSTDRNTSRGSSSSTRYAAEDNSRCGYTTMSPEKKTVRTRRGIREYTCLGCPLTRNHTAWCFRMCTPDEDGNGRCGRIAPHSLKGRTQLSVERYVKKQLEARCESLEHQYLSATCNEFFDAGVRISEGEAEVVIPVRDVFLDFTGAVHASIYFTAMADSAMLAVSSIAENTPVVAVNFDIQLTRPITDGELIARSRFLGMSGTHYLAESVLMNSEGQELGKGSGAFAESEAPSES
jgi:acyl-coenzyme A thioesterase PaaI-like protein